MEIAKQAYSEVYAILNLMSLNMINKIPEKILENIENKRDKEQVLEIDNMEEYHPSEQANKLLAVIYKNYFATDEEKSIIKSKEKILYERQQGELREKYNPDDLFKNKEIKTKTEEIENIVSIIPYKETFFTKVKNWFKNIFDR